MENVVFLIILAAVAGGSVAPFAKVALEVFPPFTLVFIRFLSAALVLLPFVKRNHELSFKFFKDLLSVAVLGSLNPILLFIALQFTPSSVSPLIYASVPLMTAVFLHQFREIKISSESVWGIIVGFLGVGLIILLPFFQKGSVDFKSLWGNFLILGAAIAFMFYGIISKEKQFRLKISPLGLTFYLSIVTMVLSIPFVLFEFIRQPVDLSIIQPKHIFSSLEIGVLGTTLFYISYQKAIQLGNELTASLFTYLQPIATILFAVVILAEEITPAFIIGGTLALIGAGLASIKGSRVVYPNIAP
jgi:drug/metabolite transporter (DMT)-like permease